MAKTRFHSLLEERIIKAVDSMAMSLASGEASDYPAYRESVGYIRGLREALNLCDEIEGENQK